MSSNSVGKSEARKIASSLRREFNIDQIRRELEAQAEQQNQLREQRQQVRNIVTPRPFNYVIQNAPFNLNAADVLDAFRPLRRAAIRTPVAPPVENHVDSVDDDVEFTK